MKSSSFPNILILLLIIILSSCSAQKTLETGSKSYEIGEYSLAIEKYRKAYRSPKLGEEKTDMAFRIGECYYELSDFAKASIWYKNAIKRKSSEPLLMLHYADCLRATQKYEDAILWYQTYLGVKPDDELAKNGLESSKIVKEWLDKPNRYMVSIVKELNSNYNDYCPVFVGGRDNEIIFTSTRDVVTGKRKSNITGTRFADLFTTKFLVQKQKWETPKLLDESEMINTASDEGAATLSDQGDLMIFTRCLYDKTKDKGAELFSANQSRGSWSEPAPLELVGDSMIAAHPSLSADGTELYFVSDKIGGYGGKDIWVSIAKGGKYDRPENLGPEINTPGDEMFPFIRETGELYFSSNYKTGIGGLDIFKAVKDDKGKWNVYNKDTNQKIDGANIRIIGTDGTNLKVRADGGHFQLKLKPETEYVFAAFKDGYLNDKARISTYGLEDSKEYRFEFMLAPTDEPIKVNNINYATGSFEITEESKVALDSVVQLLTANPTITIELMAHTDFVGSDKFNSDLSQKRAQSVVDYLISKGINTARMVAKGYGETWPKKVNRDLAKKYDFLKRNDELTEEFILKLTPEQQEIAKGLNRRTEFRILSNDFHE